jgi:hypothetical protein
MALRHHNRECHPSNLSSTLALFPRLQRCIGSPQVGSFILTTGAQIQLSRVLSRPNQFLIIRLKSKWRYLTPAVDLPAPNDASATPRGGIKEVYSMNLVDAQNRLMGGAARHEVQRLPVTGRRERKRPSSEERADSCAAAVSKWRDKFVAMQMNEVR